MKAIFLGLMFVAVAVPGIAYQTSAGSDFSVSVSVVGDGSAFQRDSATTLKSLSGSVASKTPYRNTVLNRDETVTRFSFSRAESAQNFMPTLAAGGSEPSAAKVSCYQGGSFTICHINVLGIKLVCTGDNNGHVTCAQP